MMSRSRSRYSVLYWVGCYFLRLQPLRFVLFGCCSSLDDYMPVCNTVMNFLCIFIYKCFLISSLLQIENMDALFEAQFSPLAATGKVLSKCGKCLRYMKYISSQPSRLYCNTCEEVYYVPQKGAVKVQYMFLILLPVTSSNLVKKR